MPMRVQLLSDNFNRADSADLGTQWDPYAGWNALQIVGNRARTQAVGGPEGLESNNAQTLAADQWAEAVVFLAGSAGANFVGAVVRAAAPETQTMYLAVAAPDAASSSIYKWVAGVFTNLAVASQGYVSNDRVSIEVEGTSLRMFRNDTQVASVTDTSISGSGRAGIEVYVSTGFPIAEAEGDNWEAGEFLGPVVHQAVYRGVETL